ADGALGRSLGIYVGGSDEVDAGTKGRIDDPLRVGSVGAIAEGHGPEAYHRHFEAAVAKPAKFHSHRSIAATGAVAPCSAREAHGAAPSRRASRRRAARAPPQPRRASA